MSNTGKKGKTGKKSPRPSHSGRPVSVKKTSSEPAANSVKKKKRKTSRKNKPLKFLRKTVMILIFVIVISAVCALGYGTIKVFNNAEITTLVIGVIGGLLSFAINFIDEKLKK